VHRGRLVVAGSLVIGVLAGIALERALGAQKPAIERTVLQRVDNPGARGHEAVMAMVDFPRGAVVGRHTHPGVELGYVLDGAIVVEHQGRTSVTKKAGEFFQIDAGAVHDAHNDGPSGARILAIYLVEQGKPLATPAK
jgi:quercetin dioxygenase-like cupin family protein